MRGIPGPAIAIVGNLNLDVRTSPLSPSAAILSDGETSAEEIRETVGGGGANTAAAAAVLGGQVHFCCAIGNDELGRRLVRFLEGMGVAMHPTVKPVATGHSVALTWNNHQRHFVSSLPNTHLLEETDVDVEELRRAGCGHLYRADVWFAGRMLARGNASLLRRAREAGMETSLDVNWDPVWSRPAERERARERADQLRAALPFVSYVHGNERELAVFTAASSEKECARRLMEWGAGAVIVHRGERGCAAATPEGWTEVAAVRVGRVVNETGTGDVFTAAFLLSGDRPLRERLESAAAAAAGHLQGSRQFIPPLG